MGNKISAERMRKMKAKRAAEPDFDEEKHRIKERLRIQTLRKEIKEQTKRGTKKITERR